MHPDDRFLCETHKCLISVSGCIKRQKVHRPSSPAWMKNKIPIDPKCADCAQGQMIRTKQTYKPIIKEEKPMKENTTPEPAPAPKATPIPMKTCRDCGQSFPKDDTHFYVHISNQDGFDTRCKTCSKKSKRPVKPRAAKPAGLVIQVDFTTYPALYERLEKSAWADFRTPEHQILALIAKEA